MRSSIRMQISGRRIWISPASKLLGGGRPHCPLSHFGDRELYGKSLIEKLRRDPKPIILVIFGEHIPLMGNGDALYEEMGVNINIFITTLPFRVK